MHWKSLLLVAALTLMPVANAAVASTSVSVALYVWPTTSHELSSPFGPREKASESYRYDFHRGVDIQGTLGDPVYAIGSGTVYRVYKEGNTVYPNGGNVIVLQHKNTDGTKFYSLYMHLNTMTVAQGTTVSKGQAIGTLGHSGDTTFNHLHFEIRQGTVCSLEAQLKGGSCSYYGYDPHMNPLKTIGTADLNAPTVQVISTNPLTVRVTVKPTELDFNRIEVVSGTQKKILDFNTREGFDATSTTALDQSTVNGVTIAPAPFNSKSTVYSIDFSFSGLSSYDSISAKDVWGNETLVKFNQ